MHDSSKSNTIEVEVGGQRIRLVSSEDEAFVHRLADTINQKLEELLPSPKQCPPRTFILVAFILAYELEQERAQRSALYSKTHNFLFHILKKIESIMDD
ncbi:cell division protein ZapA [Pajaroellobacter abortibovis]|uniref:Cell division protein ZapA n=1 Tax=Pajaroellobacter abortibovis TaxID=1882918 RepID=A0A1L6MUP9_9BACT|nr:cell division protein ZapA [Pajaroellobacter abortibovis]APR99240.1 hypothetical protein BCY86_00045 [Pajaroellobacter abortibovis]